MTLFSLKSTGTHMLFSFYQASPYNTLMYTVIGESPAPLYFDVGETTGEVTLRSSLYQDTANEYIVSIFIVSLCDTVWHSKTSNGK